MGLRAIEQKIESLFEGLFGRAFRTNVQPVEIARKLAKEMDDHRTVSVSRVYAPNEYTVYLSTGYREQFSGYENSLLAELEEYLSEHATREGYALLTPVRVVLETDDDLALGEFGIGARMVQPRRGHREDEPQTEGRRGARDTDCGHQEYGPRPQAGEAVSSARIQAPQWLQHASRKQQHHGREPAPTARLLLLPLPDDLPFRRQKLEPAPGHPKPNCPEADKYLVRTRC